jgi:hypothetical protein
MQFYRGETNTRNWDGANNFGQVFGNLSGLLGVLGWLTPLAKGAGVADLSGRSNALADIVVKAEQYRDAAEKALEQVEKAQATAGQRLKQLQDHETRAETIISKADSLQQQVSKDQGTVSAALASVEATAAKAGSLEQQVIKYAATFDAFQQQIDQRNAAAEQLLTTANATETRNRDRENEIERLTQASDAMLRGATNAGLSQSLEETRQRYAKRMRLSAVGFVISTVALLICVIPVAAHLVPGLFGPLLTSQTEPETPYAVAGKILLLVPMTWLTYFFARQHAHFFHLEREYGHKAALARSVEGFRRQAEKWQEEIAMAVFLEIRANPAANPSPDPAAHPLQALLTKLWRWVAKKGSSTDPGDPPQPVARS